MRLCINFGRYEDYLRYPYKIAPQSLKLRKSSGHSFVKRNLDNLHFDFRQFFYTALAASKNAAQLESDQKSLI